MPQHHLILGGVGAFSLTTKDTKSTNYTKHTPIAHSPHPIAIHFIAHPYFLR